MTSSRPTTSRPLTATLTGMALLVTVAWASPAPARADAGAYASLASQASRLDALGPFLERYVGSCRDPEARADCEANVRQARKELDRGTFAATVEEQTLDLVKVERRAGGYRFVVTPFIDGGGLALTHGQPVRQDGAGHPLIGLLVLDGGLPAGMDELALESALRTGRLQLEVVFRPQGTWRLPRKGAGGFYEGVKARFLGVRLVETRSGAEVASRVF